VGGAKRQRIGRAAVRNCVGVLVMCCGTMLAVGACSSEQTGGGVAVVAGEWTELKPAGDLPSGESMVQMAYDSDSGNILLCGSEQKVFMSTWSYDPGTQSWTGYGDATNGPLARTAHSLVYEPQLEKVIMFGGGGIIGGVFNDIWSYDPDTHGWNERHPAGNLPSPRSGQSMVYHEGSGRIVLFGGQQEDTLEDDGLPFNLTNDTWTYDARVDVWTDKSPAGDVPSPRSEQSMVYDTRSRWLFMFGGLTNDGYANDTWIYDSDANIWTEVHPVGELPAPRSGHSMVYDARSEKVVMFGGATDEGEKNEVWTYDFAANEWRELHPAGELPARRNGQSMVYDPVSGCAVVFGGIGRSGMAEYFDMWAYGLPQ
jgi:hypothetical protein